MYIGREQRYSEILRYHWWFRVHPWECAQHHEKSGNDKLWKNNVTRNILCKYEKTKVEYIVVSKYSQEFYFKTQEK